MKSGYFASSLFWSTTYSLLNAILGFITVPILLVHYGKANYGVLSIAIACNAYIQLLDLGMNTGAVKFYSQWKAKGEIDKIFRVARSNISFYLFVATLNIVILLCIAVFGEKLFSVSNEQFLQIRNCLFIIATFCAIGWVTTVFNQLLIADKQIVFIMRVQCVQVFIKAAVVTMVLMANLTLTEYFFYLTSLVALAIIPYAFKCWKDNLIDSVLPAWYWVDFKVVLSFSLSILALSIFQMTAAQSRPILLSIFALNGATAVADFRIIEVVPQLLITISGTFTSIFLPRTSEMVAKNDELAMHEFAYKWTTFTTVVTALMCFPFILCASEVLTAYVGPEYAHLSKWLIIWCVTIFVQLHTTPGNALILAHGQTNLLVKVTAVACICSMLLNVFLSKYLEVGSAVIAYFLYVISIIGLYYIAFYKKLLRLNSLRIFKSFFVPAGIATLVYLVVYFIPISTDWFGFSSDRLAYIFVCILKSLLWAIPYLLILHLFKVVNFKQLLI